MKALVLEDIGRLVYRDVPTPTPRAGEVLLHIKACGICSSDFDRCLRTGTYHFPTIPGHEFSGQIVLVGEGVCSSLVGKRAAVFPLLPCMKCDQCRIEAYARCHSYNYFGSRCDGAFAEYIAVPAWNLQLFDDSLDYSVAALCEPAAVAYHAVASADLKASDSVCVIGTGTIGILAGLLARERGCAVSFFARNSKKSKFLETLGFDSILTSSGDEKRTFHNVMECVGSDDSLAEAVAHVATAGRIVLVGNPDGDKSLKRKAYWKILRRELTIKGAWNSSYKSTDNEWRKVLDLLVREQGVFSRLITSRFVLGDGIGVFDAMRNSSKLEIKGMFINE